MPPAPVDMDIDPLGLLKDGRGVKLAVEGIPQFVTHQQLHAIFLAYGAVLAAHVVLPAIGSSGGFGYVYMKTSVDAEKACDAFKGLSLGHSLACRLVDDRGEGCASRRFPMKLPRGSA